MATPTKTLYDTDFAEWSDRMAALIRAGKFQEIDAENVAEEIESLGKSERRGVRSQLQRIMMHKIKQQLQPERDGSSWQGSIRGARKALLDAIEESPSLRRHLHQNLQKIYKRAVEDAQFETQLNTPQPKKCPWGLDVLLQGRD